jgi:hypothetical protein
MKKITLILLGFIIFFTNNLIAQQVLQKNQIKNLQLAE